MAQGNRVIRCKIIIIENIITPQMSDGKSDVGGVLLCKTVKLQFLFCGLIFFRIILHIIRKYVIVTASNSEK